MSFDQSLLFSPSGVSGSALRTTLNDCFASSFEHIFQACEGHIPVPTSTVSALLARMRGGSRESPYLYSLHFKLIDAIQADRLYEVEALIEAITELERVSSELVITDLRPDVFPWDVDTVSGYFNAEEASVYRYCAPTNSQLPARITQVAAALDLLHAAVPGLRSEFDELMTTIIFAQREQSDADVETDGFGGASALRAFGGMLLNVEVEQTVVDCAASLIHEQAHNVLFALSPMEGVVENSEEERFSSPLRYDARPLEGIYHATFVLARMVYGMAQMRASGQISDKEDTAAAMIEKECIPLFFDGLETVRNHGKLTPQGILAMDAAEEYMAVVA